jgi:hypothetical protein
MKKLLLVLTLVLYTFGCGRDLNPNHPKYSKCPKCTFHPRFTEHDIKYDKGADKLRITCYECEYEWLVQTKEK